MGWIMKDKRGVNVATMFYKIVVMKVMISRQELASLLNVSIRSINNYKDDINAALSNLGLSCEIINVDGYYKLLEF